MISAIGDIISFFPSCSFLAILRSHYGRKGREIRGMVRFLLGLIIQYFFKLATLSFFNYYYFQVAHRHCKYYIFEYILAVSRYYQFLGLGGSLYLLRFLLLFFLLEQEKLPDLV